MATTTYALERWDLSDLFPGPDSKEYEQAGGAIEESLAAFEAERARLNDDLTPQALFEILQQYEGLARQMSRYLGFAFLRFAEDTQDSLAQTRRGRGQRGGERAVRAGRAGRTQRHSPGRHPRPGAGEAVYHPVHAVYLRDRCRR